MNAFQGQKTKYHMTGKKMNCKRYATMKAADFGKNAVKVIHFDQKYPALSVWDYFRLLTAQFVVAQ
jgi:hypothetical protein